MRFDDRGGTGLAPASARWALRGSLALGLLFLTSCAISAASRYVPPPVRVAQVVKWSQQGVPPDEIVRRMQESRTVYRLSASDLAKLRDEGVPDQVIDYMQDTYLDAEARSARLSEWRYWHRYNDGYWYGGEAFGWPYYWYWPDDDLFIRSYHRREGHGNHERHEEEEHGTR